MREELDKLENKIKRIKIKQDIVDFEENFSKNDNIICVLDNLTNGKNYYKNLFLKNLFIFLSFKFCWVYIITFNITIKWFYTI